MKKLLIIAALLAASLGAMAQTPSSNITFANRDSSQTPPFLQPVYNVDGVTPLSGTGYFAQLYWASTAAGPFTVVNDGAAAADPVNFRTGTLAGVWQPGLNGAGRAIGQAKGNAFFVVRAWDATAGNTFAAAVAANKANGQSAVFQASTTEAPDLPGTMLNFKSFQLTIVPEPSTIALGLLGAGALLLRRRK